MLGRMLTMASAAVCAMVPALAFTAPALPPLLTTEEIHRQYAELTANTRGQSDAERLQRIFELAWQYRLNASPELATSLGYAGHEGEWSDPSQAALDRHRRERAWPEQAIASIDRSRLAQKDQLNYDLFRRELELDRESERFPEELMPVNQLGGIQQAVPDSLDRMPRDTVKQYEHILTRLRGVPQLIEQNLALLKRGLKAGITPPQIALGDVPEQALRMTPDEPMKSPLLQAFTRFPATIPAGDQQRLRAAALEVYKQQLLPAYRGLYKFLKETYVPGARKSIGLSALPNGDKWYAFSARSSTTTTLTPRQIHDLGLREVARIRGEMDKLIAQLKFQGDFAAFLHFLATDPRFFYTNEADLLTGYRDIAKRIDPELPHLFGTLPRLTYGVRPQPAYSAPSQPAAYYYGGSARTGRAGYFNANTYNLPSRPKWQMEALTLHEAVPGHHLQTALAEEMDTLPEFRKYGGTTAYTEGWALYAEGLGEQLGLYQDPYSKFGALSFEMWRAVRLVVDTGIHAFGWTRDQAIDYMQANTGKDRHEATVEIDRYIVWPGQALAYKIGQLKILELRAYAEKTLGESFDIRAFHDAVLANGSIPLDSLETLIHDWVDRQRM